MIIKNAKRPEIILASLTGMVWLLAKHRNVDLSSNSVLYFLFLSSLIILSTILIWRAGNPFSAAAKFIQDHYNIPSSIKAAVIDAVASSFPEFAVSIIAVILIGRAEVGMATIVGSALYNALVIPAASGLVALSPMIISRQVIWRDNLYYIMVTAFLIFMVLNFPSWGVLVALAFLGLYVAYILVLHYQFRTHIKNSKRMENRIEENDFTIKSPVTAWLWILGMMGLMGISSYILVEASIEMGHLIGVHEVVMAFIVVAAGTSLPDTVLSVISAKKGDYDAAISNVFGSNIFDICACLSIPVLLAAILGGGATTINLPQTELLWLLLISTIITFFLFITNKRTLTKRKAIFMGILYLFIVGYALTLS